MFDLENLNPSTRFYWPESKKEDHETGAVSYDEWVELRVSSDDDLRALRKKLGIKEKVEHVVNPETRAVNRVIGSNFDEGKAQAFADEITDFCITDWHILSPAGEPIPCTRANKLKLTNGSPAFAAWVEGCLSSLRDSIKVQADLEQKN